MDQNQRNSFTILRDYILVISVLATSTMPVFISKTWMIVAFVINLLAYFFTFRNHNRSLKILFFVIVFLSFQFVEIGFSFIGTYILQIMLFLTAYFCIVVVGKHFFIIFSKIILFTVFPGLFFYLFQVLYPAQLFRLQDQIPDFLTQTTYIYGQFSYTKSLIIYQLNLYEVARNTGPFWEPGAYGAMLLIALMFNYISEHVLISRKNIFLIVALITTYSTTAYIALFFFITLVYGFELKFSAFRLIGAAFIFAGFTYLYYTLPFLQEKLVDERQNVEYDMFKQGGSSRMASALLDLKEVTSSPTAIFLGLGSNQQTRFSARNEFILRTNGFTDLLARTGFIFAAVYLIIMFLSLRSMVLWYNVKPGFAWVFFFVIIILSQSEVYFQKSLFHCLIFLSPVYNYRNDQTR